MDPYVVYHDHGLTLLLCCPASQRPAGTRIAFTGSQQECERYMRDQSLKGT